jgi:branched-chain amino acid aminotransferase
MSLMQQQGYIWINGEFIEWQQAKIHCLTHTFHYGYGVLEGVRAYATAKGPAIFRLDDHTNRLFRSAKILNISIPYTKEQLNAAQQDILRKNNLQSAYLRPMVYYGSDYLGLHTDNLQSQVMIAAWDWPSYISHNSARQGIKVRTASFTRNHINSVLTKAKANGNYLNSILALQEAKSSGCDEALFLDHQGYIAEGSGQNVFIVKNNILYTPELTSILDGITRDTIFTLATSLGLSVKEKNMARDEMYTADEMFFTGTAVEVTPICEIDNRIVGTGKPGKITLSLQELYLSIVKGQHAKYDYWLNYINQSPAECRIA